MPRGSSRAAVEAGMEIADDDDLLRGRLLTRAADSVRVRSGRPHLMDGHGGTGRPPDRCARSVMSFQDVLRHRIGPVARFPPPPPPVAPVSRESPKRRTTANGRGGARKDGRGLTRQRPRGPARVAGHFASTLDPQGPSSTRPASRPAEEKLLHQGSPARNRGPAARISVVDSACRPAGFCSPSSERG